MDSAEFQPALEGILVGNYAVFADPSASKPDSRTVAGMVPINPLLRDKAAQLGTVDHAAAHEVLACIRWLVQIHDETLSSPVAVLNSIRSVEYYLDQSRVDGFDDGQLDTIQTEVAELLWRIEQVTKEPSRWEQLLQNANSMHFDLLSTLEKLSGFPKAIEQAKDRWPNRVDQTCRDAVGAIGDKLNAAIRQSEGAQGVLEHSEQPPDGEVLEQLELGAKSDAAELVEAFDEDQKRDVMFNPSGCKCWLSTQNEEKVYNNFDDYPEKWEHQTLYHHPADTWILLADRYHREVDFIGSVIRRVTKQWAARWLFWHKFEVPSDLQCFVKDLQFDINAEPASSDIESHTDSNPDVPVDSEPEALPEPSASTGSTKEPWYFTSPPPNVGTGWIGPIDGGPAKFVVWLKKADVKCSLRSLHSRNGNGTWYVQKIHKRSWKMWLSSQSLYAKVNSAKIS
jgi:hypothetical protein